MNRKLIKVCGMRDAENIRAVESLGINLMGFIFWPKSKRYVNAVPAYMPTQCKRVGVFVDEDIEQVKRTAALFALDIIQLHGSESPEYTRQLKEYKVIKAFNIATAEDFASCRNYTDCADYFLFDTKAQLPGGSGEQFDWGVLDAYNGATPFLLSGGIGPGDAGRVRAFRHPKFAGIDLNSRFETEPGIKDINRLKQFLAQL